MTSIYYDFCDAGYTFCNFRTWHMADQEMAMEIKSDRRSTATYFDRAYRSAIWVRSLSLIWIYKNFIGTLYFVYFKLQIFDIQLWLCSLNELKDKEYYRMRIKGKFLYEREFLIGPRSLIIDGQALSEKGGGLFSSKSNSGYYVITPFQLEDRKWLSSTVNCRFTKKIVFIISWCSL